MTNRMSLPNGRGMRSRQRGVPPRAVAKCKIGLSLTKRKRP